MLSFSWSPQMLPLNQSLGVSCIQQETGFKWVHIDEINKMEGKSSYLFAKVSIDERNEMYFMYSVKILAVISVAGSDNVNKSAWECKCFNSLKAVFLICPW